MQRCVYETQRCINSILKKFRSASKCSFSSEAEWLLQDGANMKLRKFAIAAITSTAFISSTVANAQSDSPYQYDQISDFRGTINLTIPFKGGKETIGEKPQLHLGFQRKRYVGDDFKLLKRYNVKRSLLEHQPEQTRIGFTISKRPKFLVNNNEVKIPEHRNGISTLAIIGIGTGLAVLTGAALYADALADSSGDE